MAKCVYVFVLDTSHELPQMLSAPPVGSQLLTELRLCCAFHSPRANTILRSPGSPIRTQLWCGTTLQGLGRVMGARGCNGVISLWHALWPTANRRWIGAGYRNFLSFLPPWALWGLPWSHGQHSNSSLGIASYPASVLFPFVFIAVGSHLPKKASGLHSRFTLCFPGKLV